MRTQSTVLLALLGLWPQFSHAQTSTVQVRAVMRLTSGCVINDATLSDGATGVEFGRIDFGEAPAQFTRVDGIVAGAAGGISVRCSPGTVPVLTVGPGLNDGRGPGAGIRAMKLGTGETYISYDLFSDVGRAAAIPIGGRITLDSSGGDQHVQIYARAYGNNGVVSGRYTDQIIVSIEL